MGLLLKNDSCDLFNEVLISTSSFTFSASEKQQQQQQGLKQIQDHLNFWKI